jgi:DedD protein
MARVEEPAPKPQEPRLPATLMQEPPEPAPATQAVERPKPSPAPAAAAPAATPAPVQQAAAEKPKQTTPEKPSPAAPTPAAAKPEPKPATPKPAPSAAAAAAAGSYFLQVAAVTEAADADRVVGQLKAKGYPASVNTSKGDGWQRVVVGPFSSAEAAQAFETKLHKDGFDTMLRKL